MQKKQDVPIATWEVERTVYLDELMGLEGRGRFQSGCAGCLVESQPAYRCRDCVHGAMWCKECLVHEHRLNPLHVIEVRFVICSYAG